MVCLEQHLNGPRATSLLQLEIRRKDLHGNECLRKTRISHSHSYLSYNLSLCSFKQKTFRPVALSFFPNSLTLALATSARKLCATSRDRLRKTRVAPLMITFFENY